MVRVLQLLSSNADFQTQRCVRLLNKSIGGEFAVQTRTLGRGGDYGSLPAAWFYLRREARDFDLIHAWGAATLSVAAMGAGHRLIYSPGERVRGISLRWLRAIMDYRDVQLVCPTATLRRTYVSHGVPLDRCHLIRPGVDFSLINRRRDPALRAALGLAEDDYVMLAAGESTLRGPTYFGRLGCRDSLRAGSPLQSAVVGPWRSGGPGRRLLPPDASARIRASGRKAAGSRGGV